MFVDLFSEDVNAGTALKTQILVLSCVFLFLDDVSTAYKGTCLDAASYMLACLRLPAHCSPSFIMGFRVVLLLLGYTPEKHVAEG